MKLLEFDLKFFLNPLHPLGLLLEAPSFFPQGYQRSMFYLFNLVSLVPDAALCAMKYTEKFDIFHSQIA